MNQKQPRLTEKREGASGSAGKFNPVPFDEPSFNQNGFFHLKIKAGYCYGSSLPESHACGRSYKFDRSSRKRCRFELRAIRGTIVYFANDGRRKQKKGKNGVDKLDSSDFVLRCTLAVISYSLWKYQEPR